MITDFSNFIVSTLLLGLHLKISRVALGDLTFQANKQHQTIMRLNYKLINNVIIIKKMLLSQQKRGNKISLFNK